MLKTKKLKIGGQVYKVIRDDKQCEERGYLGICFKDHSKIFYTEDYPKETVADTLIHEMLHAIWRNYLDEGAVEEEKAVTMLAHGLIQVMRDNPKFFDEIRSMI